MCASWPRQLCMCYFSAFTSTYDAHTFINPLPPTISPQLLDTRTPILTPLPTHSTSSSSTVGSVLYLHSLTQPIVFGGCSSLHFAPYNTHYPQLGQHLQESALQPDATNQWDNPLIISEGRPYATSTRVIGYPLHCKK